MAHYKYKTEYALGAPFLELALNKAAGEGWELVDVYLVEPDPNQLSRAEPRFMALYKMIIPAG